MSFASEISTEILLITLKMGQLLTSTLFTWKAVDCVQKCAVLAVIDQVKHCLQHKARSRVVCLHGAKFGLVPASLEMCEN